MGIMPAQTLAKIAVARGNVKVTNKLCPFKYNKNNNHKYWELLT